MNERKRIGTFVQVGYAFTQAQMTHAQSRALAGCYYCKGDGPEPGLLYTENNGPIVPCPVCNPITDREIEYERAVAQRSLQEQSK